MQKPNEHWLTIARSKSYLSDKFFPPFEVPLETNLRDILTEDLAEEEMSARLVEAIPNLNHDQLVDLALYLAFEAQLNDKPVWRTLEDAALASMHLMTLTQTC